MPNGGLSRVFRNDSGLKTWRDELPNERAAIADEHRLPRVIPKLQSCKVAGGSGGVVAAKGSAPSAFGRQCSALLGHVHGVTRIRGTRRRLGAIRNDSRGDRHPWDLPWQRDVSELCKGRQCRPDGSSSVQLFSQEALYEMRAGNMSACVPGPTGRPKTASGASGQRSRAPEAMSHDRDRHG